MEHVHLWCVDFSKSIQYGNNTRIGMESPLWVMVRLFGVFLEAWSVCCGGVEVLRQVRLSSQAQQQVPTSKAKQLKNWRATQLFPLETHQTLLNSIVAWDETLLKHQCHHCRCDHYENYSHYQHYHRSTIPLSSVPLLLLALTTVGTISRYHNDYECAVLQPLQSPTLSPLLLLVLPRLVSPLLTPLPLLQ